ncbi:MAG: hypothetical protein HY796_00930 [Elusimicrobia bacterium]|nr:hypothetical protein [Elusimicrobiota bacterium]
MKKSSASLKKSLKDILEKRAGLIEQLIASGPVVIGNVYDVMRRCGNPHCHCAEKPGHRQTLLIYTRNGHRHCKLVRRKDEERVKLAWQNYRAFRKALRQIRALNQRELSILRADIINRGFCYR